MGSRGGEALGVYQEYAQAHVPEPAAEQCLPADRPTAALRLLFARRSAQSLGVAASIVVLPIGCRFMLTMTQFRYSRVSTTRTTKLLPEGAARLLRSMESRPEWDEVHISPGKYEYPFVWLSWHSDRGYVVHHLGENERFSFFLSVQKTMSSPQVFVDLGGQTQELWPPELFVSFDVARTALEYFLASGKRFPEQCWVRIDRFPRRTVRQRARAVAT